MFVVSNWLCILIHPQEATSELSEPGPPYACTASTTGSLPLDVPVVIRNKVDRLPEEEAKAATNQEVAVSIDRSAVASEVSGKAAASDYPEKRSSSQGNTNSAINVKQILSHPLNKWLLLRPEIGHEHFVWVRQNLRLTTNKQVFSHPHLQEFLDMAVKFGPRIGDDDVEVDGAEQPDSSPEVTKSGFEEHSDEGKVSIPGLTLDNEDAEWKSMVRRLVGKVFEQLLTL